MAARLHRPAAWLLAALALPRVLRIAYPAVWVEDDIYLQSAFNISVGLRPYVDFIHPQMPLLEWGAAAYIKAAGASHRSFELLNGAAVYLTSVLVYFLGAKAFDRRAGIAGSLLFAWSSLVFRYHVFAIEFFVDACVLGACLLLLEDGEQTRRRAAVGGLLLGLAMTIKLTAAIEVAAVCGVVLIAFKRSREAITAGALALCVVGLVGGVAYVLYGDEFLYQALVFHFLKGRETAGAGPAYVLRIVDILGPLLCLGLLRVASRREATPPRLLVTITGASSCGFYLFLSPTGWAHNYLEPLPFAAIVAGAGVAWAIDGFAGVAVSGRRRVAAVTLAAAWTITCLHWFTPLENDNWFRGSVYGFGFVPRAELRQMSDELRRATPPTAVVVAPLFISFEANRVGLLRYPENYGVVREGEAAVRSRGFAAARASMGRADFYDLIQSTKHYWEEGLTSGIAIGGPVNAVITDSKIQLLRLVEVTPEVLTAQGFAPTLTTAHYVLWTRERAR